jgi:hypothetical protein
MNHWLAGRPFCNFSINPPRPHTTRHPGGTLSADMGLHVSFECDCYCMRALLMRSDWFCVLGQDDQVDGALGLFAGLLWVAGCECTFCGTAGPLGEVVIVQSAGGFDNLLRCHLWNPIWYYMVDYWSGLSLCSTNFVGGGIIRNNCQGPGCFIVVYTSGVCGCLGCSWGVCRKAVRGGGSNKLKLGFLRSGLG